MTKYRYQIVLNRSLSPFHAVVEIARQYRSGAGSDASAGGRFMAVVRPLNSALWMVFGQMALMPLAGAQILADPSAAGRQRPTVLEAPNGVPLVNVQTPSAAGVSRNSYKQFDVGQQGAILNNSRTYTQTQLGGGVQGNPWMTQGTARVILNEVNSNDPSRLRGYVEVGGDRAQVVIANPAGITCDGCGFINANRATLTTGTPVINGGALEGYRVKGGAIQVSGRGLDARTTDYTDLISRSAQINAGIWARQLHVTTGANEVSADHAHVTKTASNGDAPAFALDVGALGGMYSQKIVLLGTEHGVGVRNAGTLGAQAGELLVTAEGRLINTGAMQAKTDTRLVAGGGVTNAGTLSARRELSVSTSKDIDNTKGTINAQRLDVNAQSLANRDGALEQTGAQALTLRAAHISNRNGGRIGVVATTSDLASSPARGEDRESGTYVVAPSAGSTPRAHGGKDKTLTLASLSDGALNIASALDNDSGRILAGGSIDLIATGGLNNDGGQLGVRRLDVSGGDLGNRKGVLNVADSARIQADRVNNDAGQMQLAGSLALSAQLFSNRAGALQHSGTQDALLQVTGLLDNSGGTFVSNAENLTVEAGELVNTDGSLIHAGDGELTLKADSFSGAGGEVVSAGSARLTLGPANHRKATLSAKQLDLTAQSFDNRGGKLVATGAQANRISVTDTLDNGDGGQLISNADLSIQANTLGNVDGHLLHAGDGNLSIVADTLQGQAGSIASNGSLKLTGDTTDLSDASTQAPRIDIDTGTLINVGGMIEARGGDLLVVRARHEVNNTSGTLAGNGAIDLKAQSLINRDGGAVQAAGTGATSIDVAKTVDNTGGTLASTRGDLTLNSGALNNAAGLLQSVGAMRIDTHGHSLINTDAGDNGGILSGGVLTLNSGELRNRAGVLHSQGDLTANMGPLDNTSGQFGSHANVRLDAPALNNHGGKVQAGQDLGIGVAGIADNNGGLLAAGNVLNVTAGQILNRDTLGASADRPLGLQGDSVVLTANRVNNIVGVIAADQHIGINGSAHESEFDNTGGKVSSPGSITMVVNRTLNSGGALLAGKSLSLTANSLGGSGSLSSKGDLALALQQDFSNDNQVTAGGRAVISTAGLLNNRRTLQASDLEVRGSRVDNTVSGQIIGDKTLIAASNTLTNRGLIDGRLTRIETSVLDNVGTGRIYGDHLAIKAGTVQNRDEGGRAAVIAARERLDIGASHVSNRERALLFSAGSLNIGANLDGSFQASGLATQVLNDSATIESLGGMTLETARLLNRNLHFSTELVQVGGPTKVMYLHPRNESHKRDIGDYARGSVKGTYDYKNKQTGVKHRNWTQFDVTRSEYETQVTGSAPALIRTGGNLTLRCNDLVNDKSQIIVGRGLQGDLHNLRDEAVFGEQIVHEQGTSQYTYTKWHGGAKQKYQRNWEPKSYYTPADIMQTVALDVSRLVQHTSGGGSGFVVGGRKLGQVAAAVGGAAPTTIGVGPKQIQGQAADDVADPGLARRQDVVSRHISGAIDRTPAVIRTIEADIDVPTNSLFRHAPDASGYLVETDPRFTQTRKWLGSDYMLTQVGHDPSTTHKRLGDGFYEQKLVRDQISQLTGRRFLGSYSDDEVQYRALLDAGSSYARTWNLRPGVALSAEQMAQLTSDIVWVVECEVTLADGTATRVLVPQVYVRVKQGDLNGNGTLIAADSVDLNLKGDLVNSGTIVGRTAVKLTGQNLRNLNGRITGNAIALSAKNDIDNIGGTLEADSALALEAGRDITVRTTTQSDAKQAGQSNFSRSNLDRVAGLYVTSPGGTLIAMSGRDANLIAAQVINSGKDGQTAIVAGRDLNLGTVKVAAQESNVRNANNYLTQGYVKDVGSTVQTQGDLHLHAGGDFTARAATVTSEHGALVAVAQSDVNILAGESSSNWSEGRKHKSRGALGSRTTTSRNSLEETFAVSTIFSANTVAMQGQNLSIIGSNVVSDARTAIVAKNELTIQAATETRSESHFKETKKSGLLYSGGVAFTVGNQLQSLDQRDLNTRAAFSTVGATDGNVTLVAGNYYQQVGSHILAPKGDIDVHAKKVDIVEARETGLSTQESKFRQSGFTVAFTAPVISAIQTGQQMSSAASNTSDPRMQALAAATTGLSAVNAYDAVKGDPQAAGGLNISITMGGSKSSNTSSMARDTAAGANIAAGNDVRISATGAGQNSVITLRGSNINATGNAHLKADGDIALLAAQNTGQTDRKSSGSSAGVGVAISVGQGGVAMGITANANASKGKGDGKDLTWANSHLIADERLTLASAGDTTLRGAVASGKQVVADVSGKLLIESLQDTSTFKSKDQSIGGSATVGAGFAGSANVGQQKIDSVFASVIEQSRIEAGDGGFQIKVKGNTDLKGAAITSSELAVKEGLNTLITGTLTTSDIENRAHYKASSVNLGAGYSTGNGGMKEVARYGDGPSASSGVGTDQQGKAATGGQVPGTTLPSNGQFSAAPPIAMAASGKSSSTTHSGISGAQITITDVASQQALTGQTVEERLASLNRQVETGKDGSNALKPIFNEQEITAGFEIVGALQREAGTFLNNRVKETKQAKEALDHELAKPDSERDAVRLAELQQRLADGATWAPGGTGRQVLTALSAAAGGNVTGSSAQFAQGLVVNYAQQQGAGYIGKLVSQGALTEGSPAHAALHAIVACTGAAASSQNCGDAALAAAASSLLTNLFQSTPDQTPEQQEAKRNLVASLVAGIATTGGLNVATSTSSAIAATDNNWLTQSEVSEANKAIKACEALGGDVQECKNQIITAMNELRKQRQRELGEGKRKIKLEVYRIRMQAKADCAGDYSCYQKAGQSAKQWARTQFEQLHLQRRHYNDAGQLVTLGYYPDGAWSAMWQGARSEAKDLPNKIDAVDNYLSTRGVTGVVADVASGVKNSAVNVVEWFTSDLPYQAIERMFDDALTLHMGDIGGIAFNNVAAAAVGYAGGKAVQLVGGKCVPLAGKALNDFIDKQAFQTLMRSGGVYGRDGLPLLELKHLTNNQKRVMGELFGEASVKKALPDGKKLARVQGNGSTGIDDLYRTNRPDVDYVVIEYKFDMSRLGKTIDGPQLSDTWSLGAKTGDNRVLKAVKDPDLADSVAKAMKNNRIERWLVRTDPHGGVSVALVDKHGKIIPQPVSKLLEQAKP